MHYLNRTSSKEENYLKRKTKTWKKCFFWEPRENRKDKEPGNLLNGVFKISFSKSKSIKQWNNMCGFYESKLSILLYRKCLNKHNSDVFALFNFLNLPLHHHRQSDFDSVLHWSPGWPWMCDSVVSPSGGVQVWITTARRLLFFASRTFKLI